MPGHERFVGMLSIPYLSADGVTAIKFRRIDAGDGPKYDGPSQKARLFNSRVCAESGPVVAVCEGELDTIMANSLGIPAVGTPGTQWLPHWPRMLGDYDRVVVIADHDDKADGSDPGKKHAEKVVKSLRDAEALYPPSGMDLSEWVLDAGREEVRKALGL